MADDLDLDFDDLPSPLPPSMAPPPPRPPPTSTAKASSPDPTSPQLRARNHRRSSPSLLQPSPRIQSPTRADHPVASTSSTSSSSPWTGGERGGGGFTFGGRAGSPALGSVAMARSASPLGPGSPSSSSSSSIAFPRSPSALGLGFGWYSASGSSAGSDSSSPRLLASPNPAGQAPSPAIAAAAAMTAATANAMADKASRHRRKGSVSISPPFPRSPSPGGADITSVAFGAPGGASGSSPGKTSPFLVPHHFPTSAVPFQTDVWNHLHPSSSSSSSSATSSHQTSIPLPPLHGPARPRSPPMSPVRLPSSEGTASTSRVAKLLPPANVITPATASVSVHAETAAGTTAAGPSARRGRPRAGSRTGIEELGIQRRPEWDLAPTPTDSTTERASMARPHSPLPDPAATASTSPTTSPTNPFPFHHANPFLDRVRDSIPQPRSPRSQDPTHLPPTVSSTSPVNVTANAGSGSSPSQGMKRVAPPPLDLSGMARASRFSPNSMAVTRSLSPVGAASRASGRRRSLETAGAIPISGTAMGMGKQDLSMPPRSGHDYPDDADASPPALDIGPEAAELGGAASPEDRYRRFASMARAAGGAGGSGFGMVPGPIGRRRESVGMESGMSPEETIGEALMSGGAALARMARRDALGEDADEDDEIEDGEEGQAGMGGTSRMPVEGLADEEPTPDWISAAQHHAASFWRDGPPNHQMADAFMDDATTGMELDPKAFGGAGGEEVGMTEHPLGEFGEGEDDGLSHLERIFVFAKSEAAYHRIIVAQKLPEWLVHVDICEAVEYVLPLLNGLATNDEAVREAFSAALCNIMWHFFTQCPLLESEEEEDAATPQASIQALNSDSTQAETGPTTTTSPTTEPPPRDVPLLAFRERADSGTDSTASSTAATSSEPGSAPTAETSCHPSPQACESPTLQAVERPRISASVFTALLGALLADMHESVAACARYGFLTLLCRLTGSGEPDESEMPTDLLHVGAMEAYAPLPSRPKEEGDGEEEGQPPSHKHRPYALTEEGKRLIVNEMIDGIVLALARLDAASAEGEAEEEEEGEKQADRMDEGEHGRQPRERSSTAGSSNASEEDDRDVWAEVPLGRPAPTDFLADGEEPVMRSTFSDTLSDLAPFGGGQDRAAEEAAMGRQISMSLIASIAQTGCFEASTLAERLLPEVAKMPQESVYHVRQQASLTLGVLSMALPEAVVADRALPLLREFAEDAAYDVRRQTCLGLPSIVGRLSPQDRKIVGSELIAKFAEDQEHDVREAATQVLGELIYAFHEDPDGVPDPIVRLFLDGSAADGDHANPALPAHPSIAEDEAADEDDLQWPPKSFMAHFQAHADAERPFACAFNFPAVALTLGPTRWPDLRDMYLNLASTTRYPPKVRRSLACSVHEVAKIIGAEHGTRDLRGPLAAWLGDVPEVVEAVLEHLPVTLGAMGSEAALDLLQGVEQLWVGETASAVHWRARETATSHLPALVDVLGPSDAGAARLASSLDMALRDPVAAVRDKGIQAVPALYRNALSSSNASVDALFALVEDLANDPDFRKRVVSLAAMLAIVKTPPSDRSVFEARLLATVSKLAGDKVAGVRIGVSRLAAELCLGEGMYADRSTWPLAIHHLVSDLVDDRESVVRAFVAPLAPPPPSSLGLTNGSDLSSPVAALSTLDAADETMKEDDEMMSSGVEIFRSELPDRGGRAATPEDGMEGVEEENATPKRRTSPLSDMDLDSPIKNATSSSSPVLAHGAVVAPSLESAMSAPVFSRPPPQSPMSRSEPVWMREVPDDGFVEVGREAANAASPETTGQGRVFA